MIQAVLFKKDFWNKTKAKEHLKQEKLNYISMRITDTYYRYRINEPNYKKYNYIIKRGKNNIDYIIGINK